MIKEYGSQNVISPVPELCHSTAKSGLDCSPGSLHTWTRWSSDLERKLHGTVQFPTLIYLGTIACGTAEVSMLKSEPFKDAGILLKAFCYNFHIHYD
ncbi:hypothetical protein NPIL_362631 [Nephila pilipes]|uniref:Uncharacterized protein n=1 Tax=Nephila pilipes TaxID=299642 RepID=A0A8X6TTM4_NEPPI|nr:hypothetical protein NPIL_362631 [Nephila pilipes]